MRGIACGRWGRVEPVSGGRRGPWRNGAVFNEGKPEMMNEGEEGIA